MSKKMKHEESKETPEMEAKYHSKKFLHKAAKLSERKLGKGKEKKHEKKGKKHSRKRA